MSQKLQRDQRGIASIMVTLIMMIVISLIVVGFAQVTRRNQREALDQQLSTQAFYAAESGVNDTTKVLKSVLTSGGTLTPKTDCTNSGAYAGLTASSTLGSGVSYACILVDPTPTTLTYTSIQNQRSTVVPIDTDQDLRSLTFSWGADGTNTNPTACNDSSNNYLALPPAIGSNSWGCSYGLLRVDLVQITSGTPLTAAGLSNYTLTFFLKPTNIGATNEPSVSTFQSYDPVSTGQRVFIVATKCSNGTCSAKINFTNTYFPRLSPIGRQYYARLSGMYRNVANLTISGTGSSGAVHFSNAQAVIDSTGKAQDQLRRISVRLPLLESNTDLLPNNALQSAGSICKRYYITAPVAGVSGLPTTPTPNMCMN